MAEPTRKAQEIEDLLDDVVKPRKGMTRREAITNNRCTWCGGPAEVFRDQLSLKEYSISGFCQKCQDETFGR